MLSLSLMEKPGPGEVLLKIEYSSMIALDTYMADSVFLVQDYPVVLGFNASGIVYEVGSEVNELAVGDRVSLLGLKDLVKIAYQQFVRLRPLHTRVHVPRPCSSTLCYHRQPARR